MPKKKRKSGLIHSRLVGYTHKDGLAYIVPEVEHLLEGLCHYVTKKDRYFNRLVNITLGYK